MLASDREVDVDQWAATSREGERTTRPTRDEVPWEKLHAGARSVLNVDKDGRLLGFKTIDRLKHHEMLMAVFSPDAGLKSRERCALGALIARVRWGPLDDAHEEWGPHCVWEGTETLAKRAGMDRGTLGRALDELEGRGLVYVLGPGAGRNGNSYLVQVDRVLGLRQAGTG